MRRCWPLPLPALVSPTTRPHQRDICSELSNSCQTRSGDALMWIERRTTSTLSTAMTMDYLLWLALLLPQLLQAPEDVVVDARVAGERCRKKSETENDSPCDGCHVATRGGPDAQPHCPAPRVLRGADRQP